jgi:hypothetical protein
MRSPTYLTRRRSVSTTAYQLTDRLHEGRTAQASLRVECFHDSLERHVLVMGAQAESESIAELAEGRWHLAELAERYRRFIADFERLLQHPSARFDLQTSFVVRTLLIHGARAVIRVSLAALVTIYLLLFLAAVFLLWIFGEWNRRRREQRALRHRLRCVICAFEFEDRTPTLLPRCPRCGSLNERFKLDRI